MTKIIPFFFTAIFFSLVSSAQSQSTVFKINGSVQGYSSGTWLYLHDLSDGSYKKIDSAKITNNKFAFSGRFKGKYLRSGISTTDYTYRVTFWLEAGLTVFSADKGRFNKAHIKGSRIQSEFNKLTSLRDTLENTAPIDHDFIRQNPSSVIAAFSLTSYCNVWSKDTVAALYKSFSSDVKQTSFGKKIKAFLLLNKELKIGDKYVDFSQKDTANKIVRLSDVKGKLILIEFWGSWCGPCREENPSLVEIYNDFKLKGFEIIGVASETNKEQWLKAIRADGLTWINVTELKGSYNKAAMIYGVSGYPTNFLIDEKGIIIAKDIYGDELRDRLLKDL